MAAFFVPTLKTIALKIGLMVVVSATSLAIAQDDTLAKEKAVERYVNTSSSEAIYQQIILYVASENQPNDGALRRILESKEAFQVYKDLSKESLIRTFSLDELNAMADFYGSVHGVSASKKMVAYATVELSRIAQEFSDRLKQRLKEVPK